MSGLTATIPLICRVSWGQVSLTNTDFHRKNTVRGLVKTNTLSTLHNRVEIANTKTYSQFLQSLPTLNMASKRDRERCPLSLAYRTKLLDRVKAGKPRQRLIREAGISLRTLERIVSKESKIREAAMLPICPENDKNETEKNDDVDSALGTWFTTVRSQKQTVTGPMLLVKSKQFAKQNGYRFQAENWLVVKVEKENGRPGGVVFHAPY